MKDHPDINDTMRHEGVDAVRDRHDRAKRYNGTPTKARPPKFQLVAFMDVKLDTGRRNYTVKGLLPDIGLLVIWGPPKCYKSFWATDLGLHISLGWEYRGRRVQQANVVYCALEGRSGLPARIEAFKQHHKVKVAPFYLVTSSLDLVSDVDELIADIGNQLNGEHPGVIFIDTLNRSLVGSESKDEDMARYLAAAAKIEEKFNCLIVIVHHCGIDATRPRGHTSLVAAVVAQLAVKRLGNRQMVVTVELAKDMDEGSEIFSRLQVKDVGTDPDGDILTSLVVLPAEAAAIKTAAPETKLSKNQQTMLSLLCEAGPDGLSIEEWNERARQIGIGVKRRADLLDIRTKLKNAKMIRQDGQRWVTAR